METLIKIENATKKYGIEGSFTYALDDVSLEVYDGEFLVVLGSSGSGKSTLLNMIAGIDRLDNGSITFNNEDITKYNEKKLTEYRSSNISYVFQFFNLINELTVFDNITLAPKANKNKDDIYALLDKLGLKEKANLLPSKLSGGEQQRVSIARAMNKQSMIVLCDEPTGALDYDSGKAVLEVISNINKEQHKTVILVTHTKEIAKMADRVIRMRNGKIVDVYKNETKLSVKEIDW